MVSRKLKNLLKSLLAFIGVAIIGGYILTTFFAIVAMFLMVLCMVNLWIWMDARKDERTEERICRKARHFHRLYKQDMGEVIKGNMTLEELRERDKNRRLL